MKTIALLFVLLIGWLLETGYAQIKEVTEGDQIRITAPSVSDTKITGVVHSITSNSVWITNEYLTCSQTEVSLEAIEQLEVRREVRRTGRGALIGGGIGAFTIGIISLASNKSCDPDEWCIVDFSDGEAFLMGAAAGSLVGVAFGAIIGSTSKGEKWKRIPIEIAGSPITLRMYGQPNQYASGIRLTWSF